MAEIRQQFGMRIITEAIDHESLELVEEYADGPQSRFPDQFDELMKQVRQIAAVLGRSVPEIGVRETVAGK